MTNTLLRHESDGLAGARAAMGSDVFETSSVIRGLKAQMADEERALLGQRATSNRNSANVLRSEEHTSELQSLMRISYAVFCLKKKKKNKTLKKLLNKTTQTDVIITNNI